MLLAQQHHSSSPAEKEILCVLESADRQSAWEDLPNLCYTTLANASKIATCGRCAAGTEYTPATLNPQNMKCFNTRMYYSASDLCQGSSSRIRGLSPIALRPLQCLSCTHLPCASIRWGTGTRTFTSNRKGPSKLASWPILRALLTLYTNPQVTLSLRQE